MSEQEKKQQRINQNQCFFVYSLPHTKQRKMFCRKRAFSGKGGMEDKTKN